MMWGCLLLFTIFLRCTHLRVLLIKVGVRAWVSFAWVRLSQAVRALVRWAVFLGRSVARLWVSKGSVKVEEFDELANDEFAVGFVIGGEAWGQRRLFRMNRYNFSSPTLCILLGMELSKYGL